MQRYEIDIQRRPIGTLLTVGGSWSSLGAVNDLALAARTGGWSVTTGTTAEGERLVLEVDGNPSPDQAVEAVVDRSYPIVSGLREDIGLIIGWQVADCSDAVGAYTGRSDSSDSSDSALGTYRCATVEDLSLGRDNHIRVIVNDTGLQVIERRNGVSTTVYTLALNAMHRRIGLRAALSCGDLLVFMNVTGIADFRDPPVFRYSTLINHAGRVGLIANRDGRFLFPAAEYFIESHAQPVGMMDVAQLSGNLTPCRITITTDGSRPAMETGLAVCQIDDTRLPERQERMSRVYLRDMRASLRPGCRYRALAWIRTVDDERVFIRGKDFDHGGTKLEDLRLRDSAGKLILRDADPVPENDLRSDLSLPEYTFVVAGEIDCVCQATQAATDRFFNNRVRGTQLASTAPRVWKFDTDYLTVAGRNELVTFLQQRSGRVYSFLWMHPHTDELIVVSFEDSSLNFQGGEGEFFTGSVSLLERAPDDIGPNDGTGLSDSSDSGNGTSGSSSPGFSGTCSTFVTGNGTWILGDPTVIDMDLSKRCYRPDGTLSQEFTHRIRLTLTSHTSEFAIFEYRDGSVVLASVTIEQLGIRATIDPRAFPGVCATGEITIPSSTRIGCDSNIEPNYCGARRFYNGCQLTRDPLVCSGTPLARWYDISASVISCYGGLPCTIASFRLEQILCDIEDLPPVDVPGTTAGGTPGSSGIPGINAT